MDPILAANLGLTAREWNHLPEGLQLALIEDIGGNNGINIEPIYVGARTTAVVQLKVNGQIAAEVSADDFLAVPTKTLKKIFNVSIWLARIRLFHWPEGRLKKAA